MATISPDQLLLIGRISAAMGLQGDVKLRAFTDKPEYLRRHVRTVYIGPSFQEYTLNKVHIHKPGLLVLTLNGVTSREAAEELRGAEVFIREAEAAPLEPEEYYLHQLYGLQVETEDGQVLGEVREVLETGANEVLVVTRSGQSDALIPMIRDVVQQIDISGKRVVIRLLEGLI